MRPTLTFWGVRGSTPCVATEFLRYGGNTSCVEVRYGERRVIFDAGTGLQRLGRSLGAATLDCDLLLTHTHLDHVVGLPFFAGFFEPANRVRLRAGHLRAQGRDLVRFMGEFMSPPLFPVPPAIFTANVSFDDFDAGETLDLGDGVRVVTRPLNHPNGATGYRVEAGGHAIAYVTDTEHVPGKLDENVLALAAGADLFVYDCTYTDAEYPNHVGWGHSTWEEGTRLAEAAGAKRLVIFHHDPAHEDAFLDEVAESAAKARPGSIVAREGQTLIAGD